MATTMSLALLNSLGPTGSPPDLEASLEAEAWKIWEFGILHNRSINAWFLIRTMRKFGSSLFFFWGDSLATSVVGERGYEPHDQKLRCARFGWSGADGWWSASNPRVNLGFICWLCTACCWCWSGPLNPHKFWRARIWQSWKLLKAHSSRTCCRPESLILLVIILSLSGMKHSIY